MHPTCPASLLSSIFLMLFDVFWTIFGCLLHPMFVPSEICHFRSSLLDCFWGLSLPRFVTSNVCLFWRLSFWCLLFRRLSFWSLSVYLWMMWVKWMLWVAWLLGVAYECCVMRFLWVSWMLRVSILPVVSLYYEFVKTRENPWKNWSSQNGGWNGTDYISQ